MKIAIFGDSFGADQQANLIQSEISWIDVLRQNNITVDNFSLGGSSLYYSYNNYIEYKKNNSYDKIIFLIPPTDRFELQIESDTVTIGSTTIFRLDRLINSTKEKYKKSLLAFKDYITYCHDHRREQVFFDLMIKEILQDDSVLYIDSFGLVDAKKENLFKLQYIELKMIVPDIEIPDQFSFSGKYADGRKCHFTSVNNITIGKKILQALNTNSKTIEMSESDIQMPEHDWTYYFKPYYE
jgi:hypothetical protein